MAALNCLTLDMSELPTTSWGSTSIDTFSTAKMQTTKNSLTLHDWEAISDRSNPKERQCEETNRYSNKPTLLLPSSADGLMVQHCLTKDDSTEIWGTSCHCFHSTHSSQVQGIQYTKHCKANVNYSNEQKLLDAFQAGSRCTFPKCVCALLCAWESFCECTFVCLRDVTEKNNRQMAVRYSSRPTLSESWQNVTTTALNPLQTHTNKKKKHTPLRPHQARVT